MRTGAVCVAFSQCFLNVLESESNTKSIYNVFNVISYIFFITCHRHITEFNESYVILLRKKIEKAMAP